MNWKIIDVLNNNASYKVFNAEQLIDSHSLELFKLEQGKKHINTVNGLQSYLFLKEFHQSAIQKLQELLSDKVGDGNDK